MIEKKHTPTPWLAEAYAEGFYRIRGENASPNPDNGLPYFPKVAFNVSESDAAFIVLAVNAHDDLVRAVNAHEDLVSALRDAEFLLRKLSVNWKEAGSMTDSFTRSAESARSALAKAQK